MIRKVPTSNDNTALNIKQSASKANVEKVEDTKPKVDSKPFGNKAGNKPFGAKAGSKPNFMSQVKDETSNVIESVKKPMFKAS